MSLRTLFLTMALGVYSSTLLLAQQQSPAPSQPPAESPADSKKKLTEKPPWQWRYDPVTGVKILPPLLYQDETPEARKIRIGTTEDPGSDPDPKKEWIRYGKRFTIEKFPRDHVAYDQRQGWARPIWTANVAREIYQENDEFVWFWMNADISTAQLIEKLKERAQQDPKLAPSEIGSRRRVKYEGDPLKFILQLKDEFQVIEPQPSDVVVRFRESSAGLPKNGSWRNSLDVADMNEDGNPDLVVPPPRGGMGVSTPRIFLGDGQGNWKLWDAVQWPVGLNYGSASVGDLNGDKHMDVVFGAHLQGIYAMLGDGKGNFVNASSGLPTADFPTRRVRLADVDRDGDLDIVGLTEGAVLSPKKITGSRIRVFLNENKAKQWTYMQVTDPRRSIAGDWLTIGDFNGDKYPDLAGASIIFHGTDLIYLSDGKKQWTPFGRGYLPFYSYYGALASGKFTSRNRDDLIMSYTRHWPGNTDPDEIPPPKFEKLAGIDWISFAGKEPKRVPVARWESQIPVWGLANADFDADKNEDIIYWDGAKYALVVLLGDGKGNFRRASLEGIELPKQILYDIKVADVNADKQPDVILMFESDTAAPTGSVQVWLGQTAVRGEKDVLAKR